MDIRFYDRDDKRHAAKLPYEGCDYLIVDGACAACKQHDPFKIHGTDQTHDHDTHYARALCLGCGAHVGRIEVHVSTIFGIEEDARVTNGAWRVY